MSSIAGEFNRIHVMSGGVPGVWIQWDDRAQEEAVVVRYPLILSESTCTARSSCGSLPAA
jgi:hypothetical protein